jgi:hypothetical protein
VSDIKSSFRGREIHPIDNTKLSIGDPFPLEVGIEHASIDYMAIDAKQEKIMSKQREPGYYWVRRDSESQWEIVQVHPVDYRGVQGIDSMGWDAGACLPADAKWGQCILPPDAAADSNEFVDLERCRAIASEMRAMADGIDRVCAIACAMASAEKERTR